MKKGKSKFGALLCAALMCVLLVGTAMGLAACGDAEDLRIDVAPRIEADLGTGTYVVPRYDVVNSKGLIMAGYSVRLKSATDPNGEAAEISREASTIVTLSGAGEYTFVYTADSKNVPDATVTMDFADRTAPTINLSSSQFPAFFIKNNTYAVPEYTLAGDFLASKCYTKVYYNSGADSEEDSEITLNNGNFAVTHDSGKYTVLIHVEDTAGNFNDYRYVRSVYAPEHYEEDIVIYFNEKFGERQVSADGNYTGKFVSKDEEGGKAYGSELGSYKVEFTGAETNNNEAYFALNVPAITNIMDNKELEMYVYIDDAECENGATKWVVGSKWWNDRQIETGKWQRVTWPIDNWGNGTGANSGSTTTQVISTDNISGTRIRLIPDGDYDGKTPPHGTVYFSAMRLIPHKWANITVRDGVAAPKRAYVGQTLTLTEPQAPAGKSFDCFLVNGKPVSGNVFVVSAEGDITIGARFADGELTEDNFSWGEADYVQPTGSDAQKSKIGNSDYWALEYELYGIESGWVFTAAYVGGSDQLMGFELNGASDKLSCYGGSWKQMEGVKLTAAQSKILRDATQENPAKVAYVRTDDKIVVLLNGEFAGVFSFASLEISGDDFGLGARAGTIKNAAVKNIKYVVGETRTAFAQAQYNMAVTVSASGGANTDKTGYTLGDTVTLTHDAPAEEGKEFAYYTVNEERISGNTFVATQSEYTVKAMYADVCMLTLGEGVALADGSTGTVKVAQNAELQLKFVGTSPSGKYFVGFKSDDTPIEGSAFTPTAPTHTVTAAFADRVNSGNIMLNDASAVAGTGDWTSKSNNAPTKVEYVTDKKYDGIDGAVSESGVLKVTVSGGENGFSLTQQCGKFMSDYESLYFYAYTEESGISTGSWWCADTALTPGVWTKVTITRSMNLSGLYDERVWETGIEKFVYRFMNGKAGNAVYVTEVFGVPYADVTVSVADDVKTYVSVSAPVNGKTYKENETVTLTHSGAPANQEFLRFTVKVGGGAATAVTGDTYTVPSDAAAVEFGAEFADISALTIAEGIKANGKDVRTLTVARGSTVTLEYIGTPEQGSFFDCFKDGSAVINGSSFTASGETHSITASFATSAENMTWVDFTAGNVTDYGGWVNFCKTGESADNWVIEYKVKKDVVSGSSVGVYLGDDHWAEIEIGVENKLHGHYAGDPYWGKAADLPTDFVTKLQSAATTNVTLTWIRSDRKMTVLFDGAYLGTFDFGNSHSGVKEFGTMYRGNADKDTIGDIKYVTGESKTNARIAAIPKSSITLDDNITANGQSGTTTVFKGETVALAYTNASAKLDYFIVDGQPIVGNMFKATADSHSVRAQTYTSSEDMNWTMADYVEPTDTLGNWGKYKKLGNADHWVMQYEMSATNANTNGDWFMGVLFRTNQLVGYEMGSADHKNILGSAGSGAGTTWDPLVTKDVFSSEVKSILNGTDTTNPVTLIFVRSGNKLYAFVKSGTTTYTVATEVTHSAFDAQYGNDFGYGWRTDCGGVPTIGNIRFVTGEDKVNTVLEELTNA